jgi:hypothetical protein
MMNFFAIEQLMLQRHHEIQNFDRQAWKWPALRNKGKQHEAQPERLITVQPVIACCAACC